MVSPRRIPVRHLATAVLATVLLAGCGVSDAVSEKTDEVINGAACTAITPVLDGVAEQVDVAVREIEADPTAAKASFEEARAAVEGIAMGGGETVAGLLDAATSALDGLIDLAEKAESGVAVNESDRTGAAQSVHDSLDGLRADCE